MNVGPFRGDSANIAVALTTTMTSVATATAVPGDGDTLRVVNTCGVAVVAAVGTTAPTATIASPYVVPAGNVLNIGVPRGVPLFAAAMPIGAASASVYFMRGDGTG
jgi:hypothetical protein